MSEKEVFKAKNSALNIEGIRIRNRLFYNGIIRSVQQEDIIEVNMHLIIEL